MKKKVIVVGFDSTLVNNEDLLRELTTDVLDTNISEEFWKENLISVRDFETKAEILHTIGIDYSKEDSQKIKALFLEKLATIPPNETIFNLLKEHSPYCCILTKCPYDVVKSYLKAIDFELENDKIFICENGDFEKIRVLKLLQLAYDVTYVDDDKDVVKKAADIVNEAIVYDNGSLTPFKLIQTDEEDALGEASQSQQSMTNEQEGLAFEDQNPKRKKKRKEKKLDKLRKKLLNPVDIKYRGPLSYRWLRGFAWLSILLSQMVLLHNFNENAYAALFNNKVTYWFVTQLSDVSMPLFLVAAIAYVLNRNKSHKQIMGFYFAGYIGVALLEVFIFRRYAIDVIKALGMEASATSKMLGLLAGQKIQVNIFSDLCILTAFNFFVNYTPKKHFSGKKVAWLRACCILPIIASIGAYYVRWLGASDTVDLPIDVYPFLTTKSPFVHLIFFIITLWIKHRETLYLKLGSSREQYEIFLKTNRNSLSFSIRISVLFLIFSFVDFIVLYIMLAVGTFYEYSEEVILEYATSIGIGQCIGLSAAIPGVLLFSYTREHKNPLIDTLIPLVGMGLFVFVYIEGVHEIVMSVIASFSEAAAELGG